MRKAAVFIWRGGLSHWFDINADAKYILMPNGTVWPSFDYDIWDEVFLVDRNVTTGMTLEKARQLLGFTRSQVKFAGSYIGEYAYRILDLVLPPVKIRGYILGFSGPSGTAKSFLAKGIAEYRKLPYYKVGRYAVALGSGKYGEVLAEKEKEDPFIVVKELAMDAMQATDPLLVVDGLKNPMQANFLSYVLRRPLFGFYVDSPFASKMIARRKDPDDFYATEREELFRKGLQRLRTRFTVVSTADLWSLEPVAKVLEQFGFSCPRREWGWDIWGTKRIWLDVYQKLSLDERYGTAKPDSDVDYHVGYVEKYGLCGAEADLVRDVATAFRLLDDVLDEHRIRWWKPTYWAKASCIEALGNAAILTARARLVARRLGIEEEFLVMFKQVLEAVYYEVDVEEGRAEFKTAADWEKVARREACFRAFIGMLKGDDPQEYYRQGLEAQAKDDLCGASKGGRENTDARLKRPLWQKVAGSFITEM